MLTSCGRFGRWIVVVVAISSLGLLVAGVPDEKGWASQSLAQGPVPGPGTLRVGQIVETDLRIDDAAQVHHPGASYIKIYLSQLVPGESVTVSDPGGTQIHTYTGGDQGTDEQGGFWTLSVMGDTALVQVRRQVKGSPGERVLNTSAVVVDRYAYGYPLFASDTKVIQLESICGQDDRRDVACYESSSPNEYERSGAVARLLVNATIECTAWRASPLNRLFTNESCVASQEDLEGAEVWFNYQQTACEAGGPITPTIVAADALLAVNHDLDYALFTVSRFSTITFFGYLELDVRAPVRDEQIYIPQHSDGYPKSLAIESDLDAGGVCRIQDESMPGSDREQETDIGYYCDTFLGSSGAPVLAHSSHRVIALHHRGTSHLCGGDSMNQGVRIDFIWPQVSSFFETGDPAGDVRINELDLGTLDAIELYNVGSQAIDMAGWQLIGYGAEGTVQVEYTFPAFTLQPASYVVLHGGSGLDTPSDLYLNGQPGWANGSAGAALLLGSYGDGIDFVRFGNSAVPPSAGTGWGGTNPWPPPSAQTLGRRADGQDSDHGDDWCVQTPTLGETNTGCSGLEIDVAPLSLQETLSPGRVTTMTMTIANSGPVGLGFQIEPVPEDIAWLRTVPLSGTVHAMGQVDVAVIVDTTGLGWGDYTVDLVIYNNDVDENPVVVPMTIYVRSIRYVPLVLSGP